MSAVTVWLVLVFVVGCVAEVLSTAERGYGYDWVDQVEEHERRR